MKLKTSYLAAAPVADQLDDILKIVLYVYSPMHPCDWQFERVQRVDWQTTCTSLLCLPKPK